MKQNRLGKALLLAAVLHFLYVKPGLANEQVDLFELSLIELLNVDVTVATKTKRSLRQAPSIVTVVDRQEIETSGARTLADLLKHIPGIQVLQDYSGSRMVWIRGVVTGENERILLLIDGVPRREAASANWTPDEHIDIQNLERIEIIRGPGSALYGGNAYAGVISLFTKRGVQPWTIKAGLGDQQTASLNFHGGVKTDVGTLNIAGSALRTGGWPTERGRNGAPSDNTSERSAETLHANLLLESGFSLELTTGNMDYRYPLHPVNTRRDTFYRYALGSVRYQQEWQDWQASTRLSVDHTRFGFDAVSRNTNQTLQQLKIQKKRSLVYSWEGQLDWQATPEWQWLFGANAEQNRAGRIEEEWNPTHSNPARHYFINSWLSQHGELPGDNTAKTLNYGIFSQSESSHLQDSLRLTAGLRFDRFEGFGNQLSPRLGLVYLPGPETTLKLLAGQAFRPPTLRQLFVQRSDGKQPGNPDLSPELVTTYEAEFLQTLGKPAQVRLGLFQNRYTNTTVTIGGSAWQSSPIPRYIRGAELEFKGRQTIRNWELSWFVNHTQLLQAYDDTPLGKLDVPYLATRLGNAGVTLRAGSLQWFTGVNRVGKRNDGLSYNPESGSIVDTYHTDSGFSKYPDYQARDNKGSYLTQDISVRWIRGDITTMLTVHNLWDSLHFDPTYEPETYYDVTRERRHVQLSVTMKF